MALLISPSVVAKRGSDSPATTKPRSVDGMDDYDCEMMEPDLTNTNHLSFVDGRCNCCPYGFHVDLDFLRYLESLGKSGGSADAPGGNDLRAIRQNKKKLRESMEIYLRQQQQQQQQQDFDDRITNNNNNTMPSIGSPRYYSETKLTLSRPPPRLSGGHAAAEYDSSSSVSISSGPPSPGAAAGQPHSSMSRPGSSLYESSRLVTSSSAASSRVPSDVRGSSGDSLLRRMTTTTKTTTKSMTSPSSEIHVSVDETDDTVPPGMTLISSSTLETIREQMAACLQRLKELEEENEGLRSFQVQVSMLTEEKRMLLSQLKSQRSAVATRTVAVGDCTINDIVASSADSDKHLNRTPNGDFSSDIQVIRKVNLESLAPPRPLPPPVAKKPSRSVGVGDGDVFATPAAEPAIVRVHEKELNTEQKSEIHEKEVKMVFLDSGSAIQKLTAGEAAPKPPTRSIGVGSGNVFESDRSDSERYQLHEKEVRTVYIEGESPKERKVTRNVGILCKAAMRDVGVMYFKEDENPLTRSIAVGVNEIGVGDQLDYSSGEHSETSVHVTNMALQQLNMSAFQSRHLRITNEQLQQVLATMLKKNLRSVGIQCRFSTIDRAVSAGCGGGAGGGGGSATGVNQVSVGCSDDTIAVDVVPIRQWRSIGVDNRPSVFHRASGADAVYRVDSATNTQTQGVRLDRSTNTEKALHYPAATNTDPAHPGDSVATETESAVFHATSALSDATTNTDPSDGAAVDTPSAARPGIKARSTDYRKSADLLTLGLLPTDPVTSNLSAASLCSSGLVSTSATSLCSSVPLVGDYSSSMLTASLPAMSTIPADLGARSPVNIGDSNFSTSLPEVKIATTPRGAVPVSPDAGDSDGSSMNGGGSSTTTINSRGVLESSDGSVDTLCSVVWRGDPLDWATRSAPANIGAVPSRASDNAAADVASRHHPGSATSIKMYETTTEIRRVGPAGHGIGSASDGNARTSSGEVDGSLRSIMKSSSDSPVTRRRKEISFVENISESSAGKERSLPGDLDAGANSGSDGSQRSSSSFEEGTYDGSHGNIIYSCKDDEAASAQMFDQHFRESYEVSPEMLLSCKKYAQWLQDSTGVTPKELNASLSVVQEEWFSISSHKLTNPTQVEDYMTTINGISPTLLQHIVNMADANGNTALHYAVSHGNFEVVSLILDTQVVDVDQTNRAGYTAIMLASLADAQTDTHRDVIHRLFRAGDVNRRASQAGQTALMLAVSHGKIDLAQMLIDAGAEVNIQDEDGSSALMCASEHGHIDIVKLLLAQPGCDVTLTDNDDSTAMSIAMEAGHRDIGVLLYAHVNFRPVSPKLKKRNSSRGSLSPTKK